jgi:SAM-dependent methyltransferase
MRVARLGVRTRLQRSAGALADIRYRLQLRRLGKHRSAQYRAYLREQQRRTLSKRDNDPGAGARELVLRLVQLGSLTAASLVLCVGCRNDVELNLFQEAGVSEVVGIDVASRRRDILVMDMHDMSFDDDRFDAVYASHSLEHAFDVDRVVAELKRVARPGAVIGVEVPLGPGSTDADRISFVGLDELRAVLQPAMGEELWTDVQQARTPTNDQGTPIARVVFRVGERS